MRKLSTLFLLLCLSLTVTQSFSQDSINYPGIEQAFPMPHPELDPAPDSIVNDYATRVELNDIHSRLDDLTKSMKEDVTKLAMELVKVADAIKNLVEVQREKPVTMPMPSCECQCPTLDEVRTVIKEELDRVSVTVRSSSGKERVVDMPLSTPDVPMIKELQPGDMVVGINGQAVTPFRYQSKTYNAPVTQYMTPDYEMRVLNGMFGAVRSNCRMVNGVKVCN